MATSALGSMATVRVFSAANAIEGLVSHTQADGKLNVERMPVFKSGTFKDSMGRQATWEPEHLEQLVFNFNMLRDRGVLPNVPVREDHRSLFGGGGKVIGYVTALHHEQGSGRLLADYEITEPDAAGKIRRGTLRGRSAEIGMYETNDEATYWPVFMGFAFVDIPAVEGLYSKANDGEFIILTESDKENPVSKSTEHSAPPEAPPAAAPVAEHSAPPAEEPPATPPAVEPPAGASEHGTPAEPFQFALNGQSTTDFAAVQRHITALETAATEQVEVARRAYVNQLATEQKITQPQVESLTLVALSMSDEQYGNFRAAYDTAPKIPLLETHAGPSGQADHAAAEDVADQIAILRETIANHRRAGMPDEQIAALPSAIKLAALVAQNPKE